MFSVFWAELSRDLLLAYRRRGDLLNPLMFFVMVVALFPLGVSPAPDLLAELAPGLLWVCALLAALLSLDNLFKADYEDGTLEQLLLSSESTYMVALAKTFAHWLTTGLPLALLAPLLAVMLFLPPQAIPTLMLSLLIGTPTLSLVGAIASALTVGLKKRGGINFAVSYPTLHTCIDFWCQCSTKCHPKSTCISLSSHFRFPISAELGAGAFCHISVFKSIGE